jgi:hypothetical protein
MRGTTLRRDGATRLGDLGRLAPTGERTTLVRVTLALGLAAAFAGAFLLARSAGTGQAAVLPTGTKTGVIVLDMSASDAGPKYERVANVFRGLTAANEAVGLVMFSDTAYELLPPNSPTSSLLQFERFFSPTEIIHGQPIYGIGPWDEFSGGTRISAGLAAGLSALRRGHVPHGSLLLISDLGDASEDAEPLVAVAFRLKKEHVRVRIVPVAAKPGDVATFTSLFGAHAFVPASAFKTTSRGQLQPIAASWPWALLAVGCALVSLLAANELFNTRLRPEVAA